LVEILISIVIIGAVVSAVFYSYATATKASKSQRDLVTADAVLRQYGETIQAGVQHDCVNGATTYTTTPVSLPATFSAPTISPAGQNCPSSSALTPVTINLTLPNGATHKQLVMELRSP
jgi:type II secretory pathway pseudopilin PulG